MLDLIAHHALPLTQHRHILFQARNIRLQLIKSDRQSLMAKIQVFSGILRIVQQLMRCRPQSEQRGVGVSRVNQFADGLFEQRILPQQIRRMANMVNIVQVGSVRQRRPSAASAKSCTQR